MRVIAPEAHIEGNFDGMALLKQIEAAGAPVTSLRTKLRMKAASALSAASSSAAMRPLSNMAPSLCVLSRIAA